MKVSDFDFFLPPESVAQHPTKRRRDARLLALDGATGAIRDLAIPHLLDLARSGDLLVANDTRVRRARLAAHKESGGRVEVLVERIIGRDRALAHLGAHRAPRPGTVLVLAGGYALRVLGRGPGGLHELEMADGRGVEAMLAEIGQVPLPPYIARPAGPLDEIRYQTVYARVPGAVAAPTAGLHFDAALLDRLRIRGVDVGFVTLHVGAGTFQPVRVDAVADHRMHAEHLEVGVALCTAIAAARARRGRVIAVGTTTVRALETAATSGALAPYTGDTEIFIYPGYRFRVVDALVTNFHLPRSTLLMLVCAFAGREHVMRAYAHAVAAGYRFFSYGDAMWVTPAPGAGR